MGVGRKLLTSALSDHKPRPRMSRVGQATGDVNILEIKPPETTPQSPVTRESRFASGLEWLNTRNEASIHSGEQYSSSSKERDYGCIKISTLNILGQGRSLALDNRGVGSATLFLAEGEDAERCQFRWL